MGLFLFGVDKEEQFAQTHLKYADLQRLFKCRISKVLAETSCDRGLSNDISKGDSFMSINEKETRRSTTCAVNNIAAVLGIDRAMSSL